MEIFEHFAFFGVKPFLKNTAELYDQMINLWKWGKSKSFVSLHEAKETVGLTELDNKSTSNRFKPGSTYFVPSLKIHKLAPKDLKPGCKIPVRLISCLQNGVSKRSDVFIADRWLKDLAKDYSRDMLKDSTDALIWLNKVEEKCKSLRSILLHSRLTSHPSMIHLIHLG